MGSNDIIVLNEATKHNEHVDTVGSRRATPSEYVLWRAAPDGVQTNVADVAFGNNEVSLRHDNFLTRVATVQDMFDSGKTVMKMIVSFDQDYLRAMHVVRDDGVDQLMLRFAIMAGCESLRLGFGDLRYVGVIQADTAYVHCHVIMVDAGEGETTHDGSHRGVISASQVHEFKRAVHASLQRRGDRTPAHV